MVTLPDWVKPGAIAYHKPSYACFIIQHCQRDRLTNQVLLLDAPKGEAGGVEYPLAECELAGVEHFKNVALLTIAGQAMSVTRRGNLLVIEGGRRRWGVQLPAQEDGWVAARSLARSFGGVIALSEEVKK